MNKLVKRLSPTVELISILIIGFGLPFYSSTRSFLIVNSDYTHSWMYKFTSQSHYSIVVYETITLLIIIYILKVRDWKLSDFNLTFTFRLIWIALLLLIIRNIFGNISFKMFEAFNVVNDSVTRHVQYGLEANWISILLIIIINSFFEEFILIGYLFKRLEKFHPAIVIGLSMLIRQSYHTYQGWTSLIMILPTGLIFGFYYYKYKKLWPVIMAHGFSNLIVFIGMHYNWYDKIQNLGE